MLNPETVDWNEFFTPPSSAGDDLIFFQRRRGAGNMLGMASSLLHRLRPLARRVAQTGWKAAKTGAKAAVKRSARMAKEEAINAGRAMLDDFSQERQKPFTHVVRDRAREGALKFAKRMRQGRGLGASAIKRKKKEELVIVKSARPTKGARRLLKPAIGK